MPLGSNATAGDYVTDFVHSKNKMFSGDSKAQRIRRGLGAYYAHHAEGGEVKNATDGKAKDVPEQAKLIPMMNQDDEPSVVGAIDRMHQSRKRAMGLGAPAGKAGGLADGGVPMPRPRPREADERNYEMYMEPLREPSRNYEMMDPRQETPAAKPKPFYGPLIGQTTKDTLNQLRAQDPIARMDAMDALERAPPAGHYASGGLGSREMNFAQRGSAFGAGQVSKGLAAVHGKPGMHLIHSDVPGRTDRIPMRARAGSYILPADVVSGLGQGNTNAGAKMWGQVLTHAIGGGGGKMGGRRASSMPLPRPQQPMRMTQPQLPKVGGGKYADGGELPEIAADRDNTGRTTPEYWSRRGLAPPPQMRDDWRGVLYRTLKEPATKTLGRAARALSGDLLFPGERHLRSKEAREQPYDFQGYDEGGGVEDDYTPIVVAGGEAVVDPEIVAALGGGDIEAGNKVLADSVLKVRKQVLEHMASLPGPVK